VGRKTKPAGIVVYVQLQVFVGFHCSICQVNEGKAFSDNPIYFSDNLKG
jgi:hypothetical protein